MGAARCLYEVLGAERGCGAEELRRAYRRAALAWHPDKNAHRREEAEERFKEVSNAWEVLSDPNERAWYDRHREQILRSGSRHQAGGDGGGPAGPGAGGVKPDSEPDLFPFFSPGCYRGFGSGPGGFYAVYAAAFADLADLEGRGGVGAGSAGAPRFGCGDSPWAEVAAFYSWWGSFASERDFSWADTWNPLGMRGASRKARRMMEEENRKERRRARAEFNEQVRSLVEFVQRRDPRVKKHREEELERREAALAEARAREAEERQARRLRVAAFEAERFGDLPDEDDVLAEMEALEHAASEDFFCYACDKRFKSAGQLRNHEGSRKHLDTVARLRAALEAEEAGAAPSLEPMLAGSAPPDVADGGRGGETRGRKSKKGKKKGARERRAQAQAQQEGAEAAAVAEEEGAEAEAETEAESETGSGKLASQLEGGLSLGGGNEEGWDTGKKPKKKSRRRAGKEKGGGAPPQLAGDVEETHACTVCGARYVSRSKLFKHIRESGHAALKTV